LENSRKECEAIHKEELSGGRKSVARCAQTRNSIKCRRDCSEEQIEKKKEAQEEERQIIQGEKSLESSLRFSERDSFSGRR
jgi:hypothetical protein